MQRFGTVLTFKEGVTREEAVEALEKIKDILSLSEYVEPTLDARVREFDDQYGGPVWYLP